MRKAALAATGALAAVAAGLYLAARSPAEVVVDGLAFPAERIELPDVRLLDSEGRAGSLRDEIAAGDLLVINFSFTTCETICPIGNLVLQEVDARAGREVGAEVRLLTITIDPTRDTPARMREAAEAVGAGPNWLWLTGEPAAIDLVLGRFGVGVADILFHDPVFLIGNARDGRFIRITGLPEPRQVLRILQEIRT